MALSQNQNSILELGKSMKDYGLAQILSTGFGVFNGIIMTFVFFTIPRREIDFLDAGSTTNFTDGIINLLGGLLVGLAILWVISLALAILNTVRYIQFLLRLKAAGEEISDDNLQRAYKMELYSIIATLMSVMVFIFIIQFFGTIFRMGGFDIYGRIGIILLILVGIVIFGLIPIILQILAGSALTSWAENLSKEQPRNYALRKIADGVKNIKIGRMLSIIPLVYILGPFVVLYGFWTGGNAIMNIYGGDAQPQGNYDAHSMPPPVTTDSKASNICNYCGTPKANPDASFCSVCGKDML